MIKTLARGGEKSFQYFSREDEDLEKVKFLKKTHFSYKKYLIIEQQLKDQQKSTVEMLNKINRVCRGYATKVLLLTDVDILFEKREL